MGKLDAQEVFLWISLVIGVFGSMTCPIEYHAQIIIGAFQDEATYGGIQSWIPPLKAGNLRMTLGMNSRLSSMESIFPLMSRRGKKGNSIYLDRVL